MTDQSKKILIIEDEEMLLKTLVERFTNEGFTVLQASDGEAGLATALQEQPDLILLDIVLPKMDGMTMLDKLRATNSWGGDVPVILLTNLSADDKIMKGVVADKPAFYLVKTDWKLDQVVDKVNERLFGKKAEEATESETTV